MIRKFLTITSLIFSTVTLPALGDSSGSKPVILAPTISEKVVERSWNAYRHHFIQNDGRVIDRKAKGITTSEGQAYAMLRAVWMGDKRTFKRVFNWANANLSTGVREDSLYGWKWGQRDDGQWGILDKNVASDADQLIAYSLILAHARWGNVAHLARAKSILNDLWNTLTLPIGSHRFMLAGDWAREGESLRLNPSYYLPFAYRVFAKVDSSHDWTQLIDTSYLVFERCRSPRGLPADWCTLNTQNGVPSIATEVMDTSSDFGFEAFRVLWTLEADRRWYGESRAARLLHDTAWLRRYYIVRGMLPSVLTVDGIPRQESPFLGLYGAWLPALAGQSATEAAALYESSILPTENEGLYFDSDDYYLQNWIWFGLAMQSTVPPPLPMD